MTCLNANRFVDHVGMQLYAHWTNYSMSLFFWVFESFFCLVQSSCSLLFCFDLARELDHSWQKDFTQSFFYFYKTSTPFAHWPFSAEFDKIMNDGTVRWQGRVISAWALFPYLRSSAGKGFSEAGRFIFPFQIATLLIIGRYYTCNESEWTF